MRWPVMSTLVGVLGAAAADAAWAVETTLLDVDGGEFPVDFVHVGSMHNNVSEVERMGRTRD